MNREKTRMLILLSKDVEEADNVVVGAGFVSVREKIAFLRGMFDFALIGRQDAKMQDTETAERMDYYAILSTILNSRWED